MTDTPPNADFSQSLLQQDESLRQTPYEDYRMQLETQLTRAEHREKRVQWIARIAIVMSTALMFVGGSQVVGSFDPWAPDARPLSIALGLLYATSAIAAAMLLAYYFSNLRPSIKSLKDDLQQQSIRELQEQVRELKRQVEALTDKVVKTNQSI